MVLVQEDATTRSARLSKFFNQVIHGKRELKSSANGDLFLEAFCDQDDRSKCVETLIASAQGLPSFAKAFRFSVGRPFLVGPSTKALLYLSDTTIKQLCSGQFLLRILEVITQPTTFLDAFIKAHNDKVLDENATHAFSWLLTELLPARSGGLPDVRTTAERLTEDGSLINHQLLAVRTLGQKIKHILQTTSTSATGDGIAGPGGRSDNDFVNFRDIAILPTSDEFASTEQPFYRRTDAIESVGMQSRGALHLDNQFRLLREDLLAELRSDLQIATGQKKGKRRNSTFRNLTLYGVHCGSESRRKPCCLALQCGQDLPQMARLDTLVKRKAYIADNPKLLKHQSFGCLISGNSIVAFATVEKDNDLLALTPPVLALQIKDQAAFEKALLATKAPEELRFVQVDTPVFAYEPILRCLQAKTEIPLQEDILNTEPGSEQRESDTQARNVIKKIQNDRHADLQQVLGTPRSVKLDDSQADSLLSGLKRRVSLIQGPPGTGKSFIGALLAKAMHDNTKETILVICYTNHALDQFLEDLLDIGIVADSIVRLGSKSTAKTKSLNISEQKGTHRMSQQSWNIIQEQKKESESYYGLLIRMITNYRAFKFGGDELLDYLEFSDDSTYFDAFTVPEQDDGMKIVGKRGKKVGRFYLLEQWLYGKDAGVFREMADKDYPDVWHMGKELRDARMNRWTTELLKERVAEIGSLMEKYNRCQSRLAELFREKNAHTIRSKRIIGCTTTAAAMYTEELQNASPGIILVEEAGEILESHVLTAMTPNTKQVVLIGDHKQLRPKINNYALAVEQGDGFNLNQSMFERLVLTGMPHTTLSLQHRMCPEISTFVRHLTYPELEDAPKTNGRPPLKGLQDRVIFVTHSHPELNAERIAERRDEGANSSKENEHEVDMVLNCVRYLGQQGYGTDQIVILTPYLGQLFLLRQKLQSSMDPVLNDLDSYDLIKAGLISPAAANVGKRPIKISTIDNYQGEESEIVIATLTRSNKTGEIGFMAAPQRVNVLLSRARDALIMIGNDKTFTSSRKGKEVWVPLLEKLKSEGHIYDGFPVKCERHPAKRAILRCKEDFEKECPDGGCSEPCDAMLNCGIHKCPSRCHQLVDHSKIQCTTIIQSTCSKNHKTSGQCYKKKNATCSKCDAEARALEKKRERDHDLEVEREAKQQAYAKALAELQAEIEHEKRLQKDRTDDQERRHVLQQHKQDLTNMRKRSQITKPDSILQNNTAANTNTSLQTTPGAFPSSPPSTPIKQNSTNSLPQAQAIARWEPTPSMDDWEHQKKFEGARNEALDSLMDMIGLEEVKEQFLSIKVKIDTVIRQGASLKEERFGAAFLGNPGTGKTTVARLYAKFLASVGVLPGDFFVETSGSGLANDGVSGAKKHIEKILNAGGGTFFIDEAYQLVSGDSHGGKGVLDYLLAEIENLTGKVVFVLAGYNKQMEAFFAHNPGIPSRIPYQLKFEDYKDEELLRILIHAINKRYNRAMKLENGPKGLYARIVARRIGRGRGRDGFGNARAVHNKLAKITECQAKRLRNQRKAGSMPDDMLLTSEDLIGPNPTVALTNNEAWVKLQKMIGLKAVKETVQILLDGIQFNYQRELEEKPLVDYSLNRVFVGSPGTGKTSVAKLYGRLLADLGLLSNGEVVIKNPSDFVGNVIGGSESNTKGILASTVGKVLVIDEAYMLAGNSTTSNSGTGHGPDSFKTAVIDTIVAEVQSYPGEDRCVLLLGYEDQMENMFRDVNPGLARRFPLGSAFRFEDFSDDELRRILDLKLDTQGFEATDQAKNVAMGMLSRARNRPNFGNAGEVDILLDKAKALHQKHMSKGLSKSHGKFEAIDFDEDFDRGQRAATNCQLLFKGVIGCDHIVKQLQEYQNTAHNMETMGMNPRDQIPFNFLFKGPPGTGKTTTARKIGKIYYDMGFLADAQVEECSATDLIGQYIGHTGPKVQKVLEKALGKVLFIDEAYRLAEGHFATEAMDELVDCLTKPKYAQKMITILAGYDQDINRLMSMNPGLTSRFPQSITFNHLTSAECLQLLANIFAKQPQLDSSILTPLPDGLCQKLIADFDQLARLNSWGNGRDVQTLAKAMFRKLISAPEGPKTKLVLTEQIIMESVESMLQERAKRAQDALTSRHKNKSNLPTPPPQFSSAQPPPELKTSQASNQSNAPPDSEPQIPAPEATASLEIETFVKEARDPNVTDQEWYQLEQDKIAAADRERELKLLQDEANAQQEANQQAALELERIKQAEQAAADEEERRRHEAQRIKQELERRAKEARLAELERKRREAEEARKKEQKAQAKLRTIGVCVQGFRWIKQASGYRCAGGSHFVSDAALGL